MSISPTLQPGRFPSARSFQAAALACLLALCSVGCGGGNSNTTPSSPSSNQPAAPVIPQGWVRIDRQYYSFAYPETWHLSESNDATQWISIAAEPGLLHQVAIQFELGFQNQAGVLAKCAGVDKYLIDFYNTNFAPMATSTAQYPYTTTTYDGPQDGPQGRAIRVTIVTTSNDGNSETTEYWIEAVLRADGIYLVIYRNPSDSYSAWTSFRDTFIGTVVFKSKMPPSTEPCNYWD